MPINPATSCTAEPSSSTGSASAANAESEQRDQPEHHLEWPNENKNPTAKGRFPSCISLRVVLSMAAM